MAAERETVANSELLYKTQTRFGQSYKQHFFRFLKPPHNGGCYSLQYSHRNKLAEIRLEHVLSVDTREAKSQDYAFVVHCLNSKYQFACTSLNDMDRWVGVLRKELLAAPVVAKPGQDTIGVEIDPTLLSQHLQLGGLYLLEVTQSDIILWLPRSRKETIRWSLSCIHSLDHLRPRGAQLQMVVIELNELSATGQGTLIFKSENGLHIANLVEKYTGKKVQGLEATLKNRKSVRKRTSSQEDLRSKRPGNSFDTAPTDRTRLAATTDFNNWRPPGRTSIRRCGSESSCPVDTNNGAAARGGRLPLIPSAAAARGLEPLALRSNNFQYSPSPPPQSSAQSPSPLLLRRQQEPLPVEPGVLVRLTPPVSSMPRDITSECSMTPPVPPRPPGMPGTPVEDMDDLPMSLGAQSQNSLFRSSSLESASLPSPLLSPGGSISPQLNRSASPLFHMGQAPPSLPPRPPSTSVARSPPFAACNTPPVIPPRPHNSLDNRGSRPAPLAPVTIRPLPGQSPPPVQPRNFDSLPLPGMAGQPLASPMFPRTSYENTDLRTHPR